MQLIFEKKERKPIISSTTEQFWEKNIAYLEQILLICDGQLFKTFPAYEKLQQFNAQRQPHARSKYYPRINITKSHCTVPSQFSPFFTNPSLHWQLYDPTVFLHSELAAVLHGLFRVHSSISAMRRYDMNVIFIHWWNKHIFPSNSHPKGQVRVKHVFCIGAQPRCNGFSIRR